MCSKVHQSVLSLLLDATSPGLEPYVILDTPCAKRTSLAMSLSTTVGSYLGCDASKDRCEGYSR